MLLPYYLNWDALNLSLIQPALCELLHGLIPIARCVQGCYAWTVCNEKQRRIQVYILFCSPPNLFLSRITHKKLGTLQLQQGKHRYKCQYIVAILVHIGHLDDCSYSVHICDCLVSSIKILRPLGSTQGRISCLKLILFKASSGVPRKIRMLSMSLESRREQFGGKLSISAQLWHLFIMW